ncbi:MAG: LamG domain-containing protein, partial [Planctomycetota bacterium]
MSKKLSCLISFVLVLCLVGTSAAQNIDPSLVGWWTFDDGSGTVAKDLSGNGVDATFFGEPTWGTEGSHGGVLLFDGTTATPEYVLMDGSYQVPVYTITLWFRVEDGSGQRDIFSAYAPGVQHGILLELGGDGTLRYLHRYPLGTGGGTNIYTTTTYDDGAWYHAAMVKSVDTIALYINGEQVDSAADTSEFNPGDAFGVVLGILDHERAPGRLFPGAMDDFRIYDRPMS